MADTQVEDPKPPRKKRRRWLLRLVVGFIAFGVTLVLLVQVFLWTDYPRNIAESQVQRILKVKASIGSVDIGWFGQTSIRDVQLTFPMEEKPFVVIDSIDAKHTSLPMIAFSQQLTSADVSGVRLDVREDSRGRWNVQHFAGSGSSSGESTPLGEALRQIPDAHASDVSVTLTRSNGKTLQINPIELSLTKPSALVARFDAKLGPTVRANGEIALTDAATHELTATVDGIPEGVEAFLGTDLPRPLAVEVDWAGQVTGDGVRGTLTMTKIRIDQAHIFGKLDVVAGNTIEVRPADLNVDVNGALVNLIVESGRIRYAENVQFESLRGSLNEGTFALEGSVNPNTMQSDVTARWQDVKYQDFSARGQLNLQSRRDYAGLISANVLVDATGTLPGQRVSATLSLNGTGTALDAFNSDFTISAVNAFDETRQAKVSLPTIEGTVQGLKDEIRLHRVRFNDTSKGTLNVDAGVKYTDLQWWLNADAVELSLDALSEQGVPGPVSLTARATGTRDSVQVQELYLKSGPASAWANGSYESTRPRPLNLTTRLWFDQPVTEDNEARLNSLEANGVVEGTLMPRDLSFEADVDGRELVFRGRELGDVSVHVIATADAKSARVKSREMEILGGLWLLNGSWAYAVGSPPEIIATFSNIPMSRLGELIDQPAARGTLDRGVIHIKAPRATIKSLQGTLAVTGVDLGFAEVQAGALDLQGTLANGKFELKTTLQEASGTFSSVVRGDIDLADPVAYSATLDNWPVPRSDALPASSTWTNAVATAQIDGTVKLGQDTAAADAVHVEANLSADVTQGDTSILAMKLAADLNGQRLTLSRANVQTLNGHLEASGVVDLSDFNQTLFDAEFSRIDLSSFAAVDPVFNDFRGRFAGKFSIHPSTGPRPLGELAIECSIDPQGAGFRSLQIGSITLDAFATLDPDGGFRVVSNDAAIHIADGEILPFFRFSQKADGTVAQLLTAKFDNLDLDQLQRVVDDDGFPISGRLGGSVEVYGLARSLETVSGQATLNITRSDLANFGPISVLYDLLSVGTAGSEPDGEGTVSLRLDGGILRIEDAEYFNRGVNARAYGPIRGLGDLETAVIDNVVVIGSLEPLRTVKLPFFGDLNDIFSALQSSVTALNVSGSIASPQIRQVSLDEVGGTLRKILFGVDE